MTDDDKSARQLLVFTIDAKSGQIVKFESVDDAGVNHPVSKTDWLDMVKQGKDTDVEKLLEDAFEAGIACGVGDESAPQEEFDSEEDAHLRRMLLKPLFERSAAASLAHHPTLRHAVLQSLIQLAGKWGGTESGTRSAQRH